MSEELRVYFYWTKEHYVGYGTMTADAWERTSKQYEWELLFTSEDHHSDATWYQIFSSFCELLMRKSLCDKNDVIKELTDRITYLETKGPRYTYGSMQISDHVHEILNFPNTKTADDILRYVSDEGDRDSYALTVEKETGREHLYRLHDVSHHKGVKELPDDHVVIGLLWTTKKNNKRLFLMGQGTIEDDNEVVQKWKLLYPTPTLEEVK
jgi:hypothetical protein